MTLPAKAGSMAASAMCSIGGPDSGKAAEEIHHEVHKSIDEIEFRSQKRRERYWARTTSTLQCACVTT
jgi:hypothetical protein